MNWIPLSDQAQLDDIVSKSHHHPIVIFKHSTRCSLSNLAMHRLERGIAPDQINFYFLDLIKFRMISTDIASRFSVHHASPQVLIIYKGKCTENFSHNGIGIEEINGAIRACTIV